MTFSNVLALVKHPHPAFHKWLIILLISAVTLLTILLYSRPFLSDRTLMGNLEPFPDTFHYLVPAYNLAHGKGLSMLRDDGLSSMPAVPPLYSLVLTPIFLFQNDPRWFYVVNVLLLAGASSFLYLTVKKITGSNIFGIAGLFLFLTNHFIRWIPSLAMAECLMLFLYSFAIWLFVSPLTLRKIALASATCIALYATKYALAPSMLVFGLGFMSKILIETNWKIDNYKTYNYRPILTFVGYGLFSLFFFVTWQSLTTQKNIFIQLLWQLVPFFPKLQDYIISNGSNSLQSKTLGADQFFSIDFFASHFPMYIRSHFGSPNTFLWDKYFLTSFATGFGALVGFILMLKEKKHRFSVFFFLLLILSQTAFMSLFYAFDLRYILSNLLIILITLLFACSVITKKILHRLQNNDVKKIATIILVGIALGSVVVASSSAYKLQIVLNLKYQETPWWYLAIKDHDTFFKESAQISQNALPPVLITASIPYHYDFFSESALSLLPLSHAQDFARTEGSADQTWGPDDYQDLLKLYEQKILDGRSVYITNWGLGNEAQLHRDFAKIEERFTVSKVREGCLGACNLYQLGLKYAK